MIVSVRDSECNTLEAATAAALLGSITAIGKSKKTLIIQFTGPTEDNVLDILAGKDIKARSINGDYVFADDGIDGLSIKSEQSELAKEHFDECVTPVLDKENMLDVLKTTKTDHFMEIIGVETLKRILDGSRKIYNYIYVVLPNENKQLIETITELTDEDLILVPQGKPKKVDLKNKKTYLVVKQFEQASKFDLSSIKDKYGVKKIYTIPYSVSLRDHIISQTLLDFVLVNKKDIKEDSNYSLFHSLLSIVNRYVTNKDDEEEEPQLPDKAEKIILQSEEISELPENAIQEVTVKKGFFGRKKKSIMINLDEGTDEE